jgi:hypothetical protein
MPWEHEAGMDAPRTRTSLIACVVSAVLMLVSAGLDSAP